MLTMLYQLAFAACMNTLVPNPNALLFIVEPHHFKYIIEGATQACVEELVMERNLACTENPAFCQ